MHVTLDLTGKHCPVILLLFCFSFLRNNAGFPEPALAANVRFADFIVYKKSFVWKERRQEKDVVSAHFICGKRKINQQTKIERGGGGGVGFSMKWKATCEN